MYCLVRDMNFVGVPLVSRSKIVCDPEMFAGFYSYSDYSVDEK
jgi:hypothetical protein